MPADLTREEIAAGVRLEGWRWPYGMVVQPVLADGSVEDVRGFVCGDMDGLPLVYWPDLRDTRAHDSVEHLLPVVAHDGTAGLLLDLLGDAVVSVRRGRLGFRIMYQKANGQPGWTPWCPNLGTARFRAALARGRWG